jgi:hypothetical protein
VQAAGCPDDENAMTKMGSLPPREALAGPKKTCGNQIMSNRYGLFNLFLICGLHS